jgi:hypothetical protein
LVIATGAAWRVNQFAKVIFRVETPRWSPMLAKLDGGAMADLNQRADTFT